MFSLPYLYMHFNEGVKIGDCCDPVDHVVLLDKFTKTDTLRQGRFLFSDVEPIYIALGAMAFMDLIGTWWAVV